MCSKSSGNRRFHAGFTLVELLIVIAIMSILIGLMIPAVQKAREAAARGSCQNNLHQVGIALHGFHAANEHFPVGQYNGIEENSTQWNRACWVHFILPYLEQNNLYDGYAAAAGGPGGGSVLDAPNKDTIIRTLLCPSDPNSPKTVTTETNNGIMEGLHINYALCGGSTTFGDGGHMNGMFYVQSQTRILAMTEGTSNTLMASEILVVPDQAGINDMRGRYNNSWEGNTLFSTHRAPNTPEPDVQKYGGISTPTAPWSGTGENVLYARSSHVGGVNGMFADGSIRFMSNDVNIAVYSELGKVQGQENTPAGVHPAPHPCICGTGRCGGW